MPTVAIEETDLARLMKERDDLRTHVAALQTFPTEESFREHLKHVTEKFFSLWSACGFEDENLARTPIIGEMRTARRIFEVALRTGAFTEDTIDLAAFIDATHDLDYTTEAARNACGAR